MEKRLELERRGRNPDQIIDLNLDNARSINIVGLTDEYCNLETLSLINVGLTNLKDFPNLPKLKKLELSENRLTNSLGNLIGCPNLQTLTLCGNKIADFEALEPLKNFKHLESLDLFSCEVTQLENYRSKVFNLIPSLKYLDGFDSEDKEAKDASELDEASESDDAEFNEEDSDLDEEDQIVDDEELDEDEDEASDSDEAEEEVGLSALIGDINEESDNEENFEPEATNGDHPSDEDDDFNDDIYEDDEKDLSGGQENRGLKRKHEPEQDNE